MGNTISEIVKIDNSISFYSLMRMFWPFWLLIVFLIASQIYLLKVYKIRSYEELIDYLIWKWRNKKTKEVIYLCKNTFPSDFKWKNPNEFSFGVYGKLVFREGSNENRDVFALLTEAKGSEIRVQKIAHLISKPSGYVRIILNNLSKRIQKDSNLAPYVDVIPTNEGSYRLAINSTILLKH